MQTLLVPPATQKHWQTIHGLPRGIAYHKARYMTSSSLFTCNALTTWRPVTVGGQANQYGWRECTLPPNQQLVNSKSYTTATLSKRRGRYHAQQLNWWHRIAALWTEYPCRTRLKSIWLNHDLEFYNYINWFPRSVFRTLARWMHSPEKCPCLLRRQPASNTHNQTMSNKTYFQFCFTYTIHKATDRPFQEFQGVKSLDLDIITLLHLHNRHTTRDKSFRIYSKSRL